MKNLRRIHNIAFLKMRLILINLILILSLWSAHGFLGRFGRNYYGNYKLEDLKEENKLYIELPVDNFNKSDSRTFKNLYVKYDEYFKEGGLIILFIQGEMTLTAWRPSFLDYLANKTNALIVAIEHRYYGSSIPSDDMKYLTSKQALADMANLILEIKKDDKYKHSKVLAFGGSYGGMLSTWMRVHYPGVVDAALASSAPLLAKADFYEYLDKVSEAFQKYGTPYCDDKIRIYYQLIKKFFSFDDGIKSLKKEFNICESSDLKNKYNLQFFLGITVDKLSSLVQFGTPSLIKKICENPLCDFNHLLDTGNCIDVDFDSYIKLLKANHSDIKSWMYQSCSEFGFLQAASNQSVFKDTITLDYYYTQCKLLFGIDENMVNDFVKKTNEYYGGLYPNVSHVVFSTGGMDPWYPLQDGMKPGGINALYHDGSAAHCADLTDITDSENILQFTKQFEETWLLKWLQNSP